MNLKKLSLCIALFMAVAVAVAQNKVYFVEDVSEAGEPVGAADVWAISAAEGGLINVLYTNNNKTITDAQLTVAVEKKNDAGAFDAFEEYTVEIEEKKSWVLFTLNFTETGNFRIIIKNTAKKNLAVGNLELVFAEEEAAAAAIDEIDEAHAKGFKITFCDSVNEEGTAINARKEFKLNKGAAKVVVLISHEAGLKSSSFTLKVTKSGGGEPEVIELTCEPDWSAFYYDLSLTEKGTYTVGLFSPSGKVLNFEMVAIK